MTDDKEIPMPKAEDVKQEETSTEEPVTLNLTDIHYCRKIIEIAVEKGTGVFKPEELEVVGATYNKITKWLIANQPKDDKTESAETSTDTKGEEKND